MRLFFAFLVGLVAETGHVLAGSRLWQPNTSTTHLDRRYFVINTDRSEGDRMIWPNRQIRYCFVNDEADDALDELINAAHDVWLRMGLGSEFTIAKVGRDECTGDHRFDTLMFYWTGDNGRMATFEGLPATGSLIRNSENPNVRPRSELTTSTRMGMLDQQLNFAHELGHAWGLYHEHQNPAFWSRGTVSNALGGSVFGPENDGNWRCQNLKDYQDRVNGGGLVVQNPNNPNNNGFGPRVGVETLCKDYDFARKGQFSARDYLPMPKAMGIATSSGMSTDDVDWSSIMIYPSGAGAIGEASPANDQRAAILLKTDGSRIPINDSPSQRDIAAMHKLYGRSNRAIAKDLLQKAGGTVTSNFKKLFPESQGNTDGSGCL
ncbi:hypothetical protein C8A01DRAFT_45674 [Parachaetomium inaequale]|uniref:Uncharacterized protein n=1 Tax=Parachaetomium inaequale TaxID=2588326 RepID=A0AAN6PHL5_9PEZI|nr:hypothetical protein C8A01DRAFT_45674 [Parachaetomium inaequale]